ncbi:MAG: response regulator transcription factor [Oscillospiraceae bacterium]|jgi:two-component system alkaline phosphatase synthesis response regulator PhoP|nr:response regulator transcription factor [Oscillospiraceae bacterium]
MIYCVEDDDNLRNIVVYTLKNTGFDAQGFADASSLLSALERQLPTLLLLDIMLPGEDGLSVLRRLRENPKTQKLPIIMLTAKGSEYDKVTGLDLGADDYMTKPFGVMELVSRVKALLRRVQSETPAQHAGIVLNEREHRITVNGAALQLTMKEFALLQLFLENPGMVFTRDLLLERVWGYDFEGETRTVDVHIQTLRGKLGEKARLIETVRGLGYRLGGET